MFPGFCVYGDDQFNTFAPLCASVEFVKLPPVRAWNWSSNLWPNFVTGPRPVSPGPPDCDQFPCQVKSHPLGHHHRLAQHALSQSSSQSSLSFYLKIYEPCWLLCLNCEGSGSSVCYVCDLLSILSWELGRPTVVLCLLGAASGCEERQKFHYRTLHFPLVMRPLFVKSLKLRNLEGKPSEVSSHLIIFCAFLTSHPSGTCVCFQESQFQAASKVRFMQQCNCFGSFFAAKPMAQFCRRIPPQNNNCCCCAHFQKLLLRTFPSHIWRLPKIQNWAPIPLFKLFVLSQQAFHKSGRICATEKVW